MTLRDPLSPLVQESDASAGFTDALNRLVLHRPDIVTLGFAYGGINGIGISTLTGRGMAAQSIVNEFEVRFGDLI